VHRARANGWSPLGAVRVPLSLRETIARASLGASGIAGLWLEAFLALKNSGGAWR